VRAFHPQLGLSSSGRWSWAEWPLLTRTAVVRVYVCANDKNKNRCGERLHIFIRLYSRGGPWAILACCKKYQLHPLSKASGVGTATIRRIERANSSTTGYVSTLSRIQAAFETAGVLFIDDDGTAGVGVRLTKTRKRRTGWHSVRQRRGRVGSRLPIFRVKAVSSCAQRLTRHGGASFFENGGASGSAATKAANEAVGVSPGDKVRFL
jgi:hypothetical protein